MLLLFNIILAIKLSLNKDKAFGSLINYCSPKMAEAKRLGKLTKLVAFVRHGDRAPLDYNEEWRKEQCYNCIDNKCTFNSCSQGSLTSKGLEQAILTGKFIKKTYMDTFKNKSPKVLGISTGYNRTISSLRGILFGLDKIEAETKVNTDLNEAEGCGVLQNVLTSVTFPFNFAPKVMMHGYDNVMTSLCRNIKYDCKGNGCSVSEIYEFLRDQNFDYSSRMKNIRKNIQVNAVNFSYLAKFILKVINEEQEAVIIAGHDITLNKILNGLNIDINYIPPYSSAIFIEFWETEKGEEVVRVIFNGEVMPFGLYNEEIVYKNEFIKHLKLFGDKFNSFKAVCREFKDTKSDLSSAIKESMNVFYGISSKIQEKVNVKENRDLERSSNPDSRKKSMFGLVKTTLTDLFPILNLNSNLAKNKESDNKKDIRVAKSSKTKKDENNKNKTKKKKKKPTILVSEKELNEFNQFKKFKRFNESCNANEGEKSGCKIEGQCQSSYCELDPCSNSSCKKEDSCNSVCDDILNSCDCEENPKIMSNSPDCCRKSKIPVQFSPEITDTCFKKAFKPIRNIPLEPVTPICPIQGSCSSKSLIDKLTSYFPSTTCSNCPIMLF